MVTITAKNLPKTEHEGSRKVSYKAHRAGGNLYAGKTHNRLFRWVFERPKTFLTPNCSERNEGQFWGKKIA